MDSISAQIALQPHVHLLYAIVDDAWQEWTSPEMAYARQCAGPRTQASMVHDLMVREAFGQSAALEGVSVVEENQLYMLNIENKFLIRFKKLDEDGAATSTPTQQSLSFAMQMPLPGMPDEAIRLQLGYVLDKSGTQLLALRVACPRGFGIEWQFDVPAPAADATILPAVAKTVERSAPSIVRPKAAEPSSKQNKPTS